MSAKGYESIAWYVFVNYALHSRTRNATQVLANLKFLKLLNNLKFFIQPDQFLFV